MRLSLICFMIGALLLVSMTGGLSIAAESCQASYLSPDPGTLLHELEEKLQTVDPLDRDELFGLRSCRVQLLIDSGELPAATTALGQLQSAGEATPAQQMKLELLVARLSTRQRDVAAAAVALTAATRLADGAAAVEEVALVTGRLAANELPDRPESAATLLEAVLPGLQSSQLSPNTAFALRLLHARVAGAQGQKEILLADAVRADALVTSSAGKISGYALVAFGQVLQDAGLATAAGWYRSGAAQGGTEGDAALLSLALGSLGSLHEAAGEWPEALKQTRAALYHAQSVRDQELIFDWQWQLSRILRKEQKFDAAIAMNRSAVETLQGFRSDRIAADPVFFREKVRPVYLDLAKLLLDKATTAAPAEKTTLLRQAVSTIELLRSDELKDYLKLPCMPVNDTNLLLQRELLQQAAVMYLIDFEDRIGVVVQTGESFALFFTPVPTRQVKAEAFLLSEAISSISRDHLESSRRLYQWLIAPIELQLQDVRTLVIVPDGATRSIPFAALYDGKGYLIEKCAIVMNQGMNVTMAGKGGEYSRKRFFLGGISEAVAQHNAIPRVASELQSIDRLHASDMMQNRQFTTEQIKARLQSRPHPVVHIASHGKISGDVAQSYILTWDGKLNIEDLSTIVKAGEGEKAILDLITLSACSTAVGDDRAVLGLAGVALKAGAQSAIASLWNVDDEATEQFFVTFYQLLLDRSYSKAEAIRATQLKYLAKEIVAATTETTPAGRDFSHPFFWAPFVLTGNWY